MRCAIGVLLLASSVRAGEPVYSWRTRADAPDQIYLYRDGEQVGGWNYAARQYRSFDGTTWGPATDAAPVKPPANRVIVVPPPQPLVMMQPSPALPPLRGGPLRVRLGTAMADITMDMTMKLLEQIPGAILDSLKKGQYQLEFNSSVAPAPQPSVPSSSSVQATTRRRLFPRP